MGIMMIAMTAGFFIFGHHENMMTNHNEIMQKEEQIVNEDKNKKEDYSIEENEK